MYFLTLPYYDHVTISFLLEIWFCVPTYPTFLHNVTLSIQFTTINLFSIDIYVPYVF